MRAVSLGGQIYGAGLRQFSPSWERRKEELCGGVGAERGNAPAAVPVVLPLATPTPPSVAVPALLAPCVVWPRLPTVPSLPAICGAPSSPASRLAHMTVRHAWASRHLLPPQLLFFFPFSWLLVATFRAVSRNSFFLRPPCAFSFCPIGPRTTMQCSIGFLFGLPRFRGLAMPRRCWLLGVTNIAHLGASLGSFRSSVQRQRCPRIAIRLLVGRRVFNAMLTLHTSES